MKLEEQVLSIEQAKHLQELGLDMSDAALCWALGEMSFEDTTVKHQSVLSMDSNPQRYPFIKEIIPTYTLQEVLRKLPEAIKADDGKTKLRYIDDVDCRVWYEDYRFNTTCFAECTGETFPEAAYNMLCWVIENGYFKKEEKE